jgi:hypothetical protein
LSAGIARTVSYGWCLAGRDAVGEFCGFATDMMGTLRLNFYARYSSGSLEPQPGHWALRE